MPERSRVRAGLASRPSRGQAAVAVLLALLGFAAAVQVRSNTEGGNYPGARRGDLAQLLDSLDAAQQRAQKQIAELEATKLQLESSSSKNVTALQQARQEAANLAILAGTVPATGPGVVIRIDDPDGAVGAATMLNAVEELRDAGAEAIEIDNTARVVAQTYFADNGGSISVDGEPVSPPYVIDAIGSAATLAVAVNFPGGLADEVKALGGTVEVQQETQVDITSVAQQPSPEYASPTP